MTGIADVGPPLSGHETTSDLVDRALRLMVVPLLELVRRVPAQLVAGEAQTWANVENTGSVRWKRKDTDDEVHAHDPYVLIRWIEETWVNKALWPDYLGAGIDCSRITQLRRLRNAHAHNYYERVDDPLTDADARDGLQIIADLLDRLAAQEDSSQASARARYVWKMHYAIGHRTANAPQRKKWVGLVRRPPPSGTHTFGLHWVEPPLPDRSPGAWWLVHIEPNGEVRGEVGPHSTEAVLGYLDAFDRSEKVLGGCAFCFSTPNWYAQALAAKVKGEPRQAVWDAFAAATDRHEEPSAIADELNAAIASPGLPFWLGSQNVRDPNRASGNNSLRRTETAVNDQTEATPSSVFRIGGEASVGALAVWGIPVLRQLEELGFSIWPFDGPGTKTIVEIFPRSLWATTQPDSPVRSTPLNREDFLNQHEDIVPGSEMRDKLARNHRAFDAFYTAWGLREYGGNVGEMGARGGKWTTVEGKIWLPTPSTPIK